MNLYRQAIIIFGFVLPVLLAAAVIGGVLFAKSKVSASYDEKVRNYESFRQKEIGTRTLEAEISKRRDHLESWREIIPDATATAVTGNLQEIEKRLPSKEYQKTAQNYPNDPDGFGAASAQKSAQVELGFRATYRTMQRALLELETRMPQLQLQELRMNPAGAQSGNLNVEVNYTAWEQ